MQIQNPQYKYNKILAGNWESDDKLCKVQAIDAELKIYYKDIEVRKPYFVREPGNFSFVDIAAIASYKKHEGEEFKIEIGCMNPAEEEKEKIKIEFAWYGEDKLHISITNKHNGQKEEVTLYREGTIKNKYGYQCECGEILTSKFCPNCGRKKEEAKIFICECGYKGEVRKFCPNCGKQI